MSKCLMKVIVKGMFWTVMMVAGVMALMCMNGRIENS